jgi:dipeptidyl aminopeptidase/acylaminoacyl peptidase
VATGQIGRIGDRDWGSVGNLAWLPDVGGLIMIAAESVSPRGGGQLWLITYPEGAARQLTDEVSPYQLDFLSLSNDGTAAVIRPHLNPEIWVAPGGNVERPRRVLEGSYLRREGQHGLAWTPDDRLLYAAFVGDSRAIWAMSSDGGNPHQLTPTPGANSVDDQMSVTPDGRYIVFHSTRSGGSEIWRANFEGGDLRQLTAGGGNSQPSLSPDGQWIVYASARDGKSTLWRVSVDGSKATQISDRHLSGPEVSPDGTLIACVDPTTSPRWRLTIIPFAGGAPLKSFAVSESAYLASGLRWTPDGKAILYRDSHQGLRRQALDEEEPQLVKGLEGFRVFQFAWSRDGKHLAYSAGKATNEIILIESFK